MHVLNFTINTGITFVLLTVSMTSIHAPPILKHKHSRSRSSLRLHPSAPPPRHRTAPALARPLRGGGGGGGGFLRQRWVVLVCCQVDGRGGLLGWTLMAWWFGGVCVCVDGVCMCVCRRCVCVRVCVCVDGVCVCVCYMWVCCRKTSTYTFWHHPHHHYSPSLLLVGV